MELKVINEQGQEAPALQASDVLFGRDFNEALVHQVVTAYQANARAGNRQQKDRSEVRHTTKSRGARRVRAPVPVVTAAPVAREAVGFSRTPRKRISARRSTRRCSAPVWPPSFRAECRTVWSWSIRFRLMRRRPSSSPKTQDHGSGAERPGDHRRSDENLYLSSRNLPNVLVLEAQEADPVSLVRFPKVLVTKDAVAKFEEMWA